MNNLKQEHVLIVQNDADEEIFVLNKNPFSIGRHSSNSLTIKSRVISRCHATILPIKSEETGLYSFWLIDGNEQGVISTNGLTVNSETCLMHELKPGDEIIFPEGTKILYQVRHKSEHEDINLTQELLNNPKTILDKDFKIKTDFSGASASYNLDTRIYVQNTMMLYLLLEKELEIVRSKNETISLIFIFYDFQKLQQLSPKSYQKIFRLYQLIINQCLNNSGYFILSFKSLEIVILHGVNQNLVTEIAEGMTQKIADVNEKLDFLKGEKAIAGAYSQIPQNERNGKILIEQVRHKLMKSTHSDEYSTFVNLNLCQF